MHKRSKMYLELLQSVDVIKVLDNEVERIVDVHFYDENEDSEIIHVSWEIDFQEFGFSITDDALDKALVGKNMLTVESTSENTETLVLYRLKPVNILEEI